MFYAIRIGDLNCCVRGTPPRELERRRGRIRLARLSSSDPGNISVLGPTAVYLYVCDARSVNRVMPKTRTAPVVIPVEYYSGEICCVWFCGCGVGIGQEELLTNHSAWLVGPPQWQAWRGGGGFPLSVRVVCVPVHCCLCACLPACLSACLSLWLSVCLFVCLSVNVCLYYMYVRL